ncbi:hypothetical protein DL769_011355 [Monosporascus sp. CRB-8-3]|nr:hypothetical protein DL769_011355 [Monosporascus sp. CRB-8-3]
MSSPPAPAAIFARSSLGLAPARAARLYVAKQARLPEMPPPYKFKVRPVRTVSLNHIANPRALLEDYDLHSEHKAFLTLERDRDLAVERPEPPGMSWPPEVVPRQTAGSFPELLGPLTRTPASGAVQQATARNRVRPLRLRRRNRACGDLRVYGGRDASPDLLGETLATYIALRVQMQRLEE